jgi:serine/threonine-protein kinase RsbW
VARDAERGAARGRKPGPAVLPRPAVCLAIPSQTRFLGLVRDLTKKMAETAGFDAPTAERLALAVDEATTNVIEHAYRGAADREIELRYEDRGPEFRVDVVDNGQTVDPRSVPLFDAERYMSERRTGGLGVHLMEKIMDSVTFSRSARRNVCCLVKRKGSSSSGR